MNWWALIAVGSCIVIIPVLFPRILSFFRSPGFRTTDLIDEDDASERMEMGENSDKRGQASKKGLAPKFILNHFRKKNKVTCGRVPSSEKRDSRNEKRDTNNFSMEPIFSQECKNTTGDYEASEINLTSKYEVLDEEIGFGATSLVRTCSNKSSGEKFALKTIFKERVVNKNRFIYEVQSLKCLSHPGIVEIVDIFEDKEHLHLVTPLYTGGDVAQLLEKRSFVDEGEAVSIIFQILDILSHCHGKGIAHRDIKPENIMFKSPDSCTVVLIDFGMAFKSGSRCMSSFVGTPIFMAPEILRGQRYCCKCDIWAVGVLMYILLCSYPPFYGDSEIELYNIIISKELCFPPQEWSMISKEAMQLISMMLTKDASLRPSADVVNSHAWFKRETSLYA